MMRWLSGDSAWQRLIRTPTFKYSVAFAVLISIIALLVFSTLYLSMYHTLQNEVKERLTTEMVYHRDYFNRHNRLADFKAQDINIKLTHTHVLSPHLRRRGSFEFYVPNRLTKKPSFTNTALNRIFDSHYLLLQPLANDRLLVIGKPINDRPFLNALIRAALYLFFITVALLVLLSYIVGIRELRAVDYIHTTAKNIMDGDLSRRIPENNRQKGEIRQLSSTLNEMLERNEQLVTELQQVTNNIAHDLKSPINRLKSRMEVALLEDRQSDYYQQTLVDSIADTDELIRIFNALLSIAKINAGDGRKDFERFDLSAELANLAELFEYEADAKTQAFQLDIKPDLLVFGHKNLLIQAVSNLLHNAIKYTPPKGTIALSAHQHDTRVIITVADNGDGIPVQLREAVFKRFYRLDASRNLPGTGLGLSLVKSIVDLHHAKIELSDNVLNEQASSPQIHTRKGLRVTLTLNTRTT